MRETVKTLCALSGVSSREDAVREYIMEKARPFADSMRVDAMGSLIAFRRGEKRAKQRIMLAAHMDEVGVIVKSITSEGYLKFSFVGGVDRRVVIGKRVFIGAQRIEGVISLRAIHLVSAAERSKTPTVDELYIDIGAANKEQALKKVRLGDIGVFDNAVVEFGANMLKAKAIDDRVGCALLLKLLTAETLPVDTWFAFTVQEEVGTRGAFPAAFSVEPELAIVVEGTTAADIPSAPKAKRICSPGKGAVIPFMDGGTVYDRGLYEQLTALADENGVKWQTKEYISGGTDASAIQRTRSGARVAAVSAAVRYIHSPSSVACMDDFEDMLRLVSLFLESMQTEE